MFLVGTLRTRALIALALALGAPAAGADEVPAAPAGEAVPVAPAAPTDVAARVSRLVDDLKDRERRKQARTEILALGHAATPTLVSRMRDPDFTVRWEMANIQGTLRDPQAVPGLVDNVLR